jgi:ribonuclease T2
VLAVSWQPAFCETRPRRDECRLLNEGDLPHAAARFSLHGLWPERSYCPPLGPAHRDADEDGDWEDLPAPALSPETRAALGRAMPGAMSFLDRHQWIKHGTCHFGAGGAEEYFADSLLVLDRLNESPVRDLFAARIGAHVSAREIRGAFDAAFGRGAGARVEIDCLRDGRRTLVSGLKISLAGRIGPDSDVAGLIRAGRRRGGDCGGGIVDPAGLQ